MLKNLSLCCQNLALRARRYMKLIALAMIVKDDSEAPIFRRCLESFAPVVDGLYVTVTGPSGKH